MSTRNEKIAKMFKAGATLQEVGQAFGVTRERVRQIINKSYPELAAEREAQRRARLEEQELAAAEVRALKEARKAAREREAALIREAVEKGPGLTKFFREMGKTAHEIRILSAKASHLRKKGGLGVYLRLRKGSPQPRWVKETLAFFKDSSNLTLSRVEQAEKLGITIFALSARIAKLNKEGLLPKELREGLRRRRWRRSEAIKETLNVLSRYPLERREQQAKRLGVKLSTLYTRVSELRKAGKL